MKIFFISNPRSINKTSDLDSNIKQIFDYIIDLGGIHVNDFAINKNDEFEKVMKKSKVEQKRFYKDMITSITKSDVCIFETSFPSFGIGYLIEKSLSLSKPTITLSYKENSSFILPHIEDERLITRVYTEKNLKRVLKQAITIAKERRDRRFNFYLSTKLLDYIDNLSKEEGATKSKVMRDIILRDMKGRISTT